MSIQVKRNTDINRSNAGSKASCKDPKDAKGSWSEELPLMFAGSLTLSWTEGKGARRVQVRVCFRIVL